MQTETNETITYPQVTEIVNAEGVKRTITKKDADSAETWEEEYPDKKITFDGTTEVTRYPKGNIEFVLPKSKLKVEIKVGTGDDMLRARRVLNGKVNEEKFMKALYCEMCRFNGERMIPEDLGKKLLMNDFLILEGYFAEVNFS
jgi:hypothetical protein